MQIVVGSYGVRIRSRKGLLVVERNGERKTYPLHDVDEVLLLTGGITISTRALRALLNAGATVAVFDGRGNPIGLFLPPVANATVAARRCQYSNAAGGFRTAVGWVWAKLYLQERNVKSWRGKVDHRRHAEAIARARAKLRSASTPREVLEAEAEAAEAYWAAYRQLTGFPGRDQDGGDPMNMALNYGYGILKALCFKSLLLVGLDPYAGFIHVDKSGRPSLVLDFMEQFRPHVDRAVARLVGRLRAEGGLLDAGSRRAVAAEVLAELGKRDGRNPISAEIHRKAREAARALCTS